MENTTVWENGEPFLQNGMEYCNVSETELCNVENLNGESYSPNR